MRRNLIMGIGFAILVICIVVFVCKSFLSFLKIEKEDPQLSNKSLPEDYRELIKKDKNIVLIGTTKGRWRNAVSEFSYNNCSLELYKIDTACNLPLNQMIHVDYVWSDMSSGTYRIYNNLKGFTTRYKTGKPDKPSKIYLNLFGGDGRLIEKSDTVFYYYANLKNFSIRYNSTDSLQDIFGGPKLGRSMPLEILFFKRNKDLYLITMSGTNNDDRLEPNALYNLVINKKQIAQLSE